MKTDTTIKEQTKLMKLESSKMAATSLEVRNHALKAVADALVAKKDEIIRANEEDLKKAEEDGLPKSVLKRLKFNEEKINGVVEGINDLIHLSDPLGKVQMKRELDEGLLLIRESCPIGVIGVIFESRPDAMVQISTLCIKSGNCAILKGGSEAMNTNRVVFQIIYNAAVSAGLPKNCMMQVEAREDITAILDCHESVDLLIPRGSNAFVQYIMSNTKIPVMGHADGICHIYADKDADLNKAVKIIIDSKTQYTAVCNAAETLLVHENLVETLMPVLNDAFKEKNVEVRGTKEIRNIIECEEATEEDFATEYLDLIISVKPVKNIDEAIEHINQYGSHHTDCIVTENDQAAEYFMQNVDSAGVYQNCSTRFADGYRYGFGAEVGISTGKLHARGPVGLEGLCTYKYKLYGDGHIVDDYATGRKKFHFKDEQI
ncbi:MAG: glutamate-5-semialdehyde dehydrogenase [Lachnospiraceae bacterium]|nr:glutamate-5-semialdehyde dehydrogenase [Lachnospiraceae bacterium]